MMQRIMLGALLWCIYSRAIEYHQEATLWVPGLIAAVHGCGADISRLLAAAWLLLLCSGRGLCFCVCRTLNAVLLPCSGG